MPALLAASAAAAGAGFSAGMNGGGHGVSGAIGRASAVELYTGVGTGIVGEFTDRRAGVGGSAA